MKIRQYILRDLEAEFNTNAQGIKFAFQDPAGIYNSNFTTSRYGSGPTENWYELIEEGFVPVVISSFDSGFLSHPSVRGFSGTINLSFLVDFENQQNILEAIEESIDKLPGLNFNLLTDAPNPTSTGYNITFNSTFPSLVNNQIFNELRYIQYNCDISVLATKDSLSGNNIKIEMQTDSVSEAYIELPVLIYAPNRARQTTPVQRPLTNSTVSVAKNSAWLGSVTFYASTQTTGGVSLQPFLTKIITMLENSTQAQNELFKLKITYPSLNDIFFVKDVIISNISTSFVRDDMSTITLQLEEAYTDILAPNEGEPAGGGGS